ncbi:MAG: AAA family ATPase [Candidatus Symbiobacter sp.]|nr:AAA family ATPase [Candidatus Symbiobacter sp.]
MYLHKLTLQNISCFENAHFHFDPHFNLMVGVNGSGKSSLIDAILYAVAPLQASFLNLAHPGVIHFFTKISARIAAKKINNILQMEVEVPSKVDFNFRYGSIELISSIINNVDLTQFMVYGNPAIDYNNTTIWNNFVNAINQAKFEIQNSDIIPICLCYKTNRFQDLNNLQVNPTIIMTNTTPSRFNAIDNWHNAGHNILSQNLSLIAHYYVSAIFKNRTSPQLKLLEKILPDFLDGAKRLSYDNDISDVLIEFDDGRLLPVRSLSDGQREMLCLITDMVRRMLHLNANLGDKVLAETPGIILIDELDQHFHPQWQRKIVPLLKKHFPKIQFIVTSHSPQIIGETPPEQIISLDHRQYDGTYLNFQELGKHSYGLDTNEILAYLMNTPARSPDIQEKIDEIDDLLSRAETITDLERAEKLNLELRAIIGEESETISNDAFIARRRGQIQRNMSKIEAK